MDLKLELQKYGVSHRSIRLLGGAPQPATLDYLDLVEPRGPQPICLDGVAESQGRPLLFFVNESHLAQPEPEKKAQIHQLRRALACRGDRVYLARVRPGELLVSAVSLTEREADWERYEPGNGRSLTFFSRLALGYFDGKSKPDGADFVFKELLRALESGIDRITAEIGWTDVLSLVGRALFFRFLCDRHIVTSDDLHGDLLGCFDNAQNAHDTCRWLDTTFNGDFLPLSDGGSLAFFNDIAQRSALVFDYLRAIVHGWEPVGAKDYQTRLKLNWNDFNFAHIPVGLLSQVYEKFCWKWDPTAGETSVHYTPRNIAATLVDEVFDRLPNAHKAHVLDPACGAGVFLVLAFRRLYRERWSHDDTRPGTKVIRELLEKNLKGFDISESALKLSALSLYLTAIELDPEPVPPRGLRFRKLRNRVLFSARGAKDPAQGVVIGSLGPRIGKRFDGQFDVILSNPPWTSIPQKKATKKTAAEAAHLEAVADALEKVSKAVIAKKNETLAEAYQNPDRAPDLPFLWKSTQWCKPNGRIAMALPTRILFKQEIIPRRACETIFRLMEVTGIINGSNLSDTQVWPEMSQPFMLLFTRNRVPRPGYALSYISPHCDMVLNRDGQMRIDSDSAQRVGTEAGFEERWLWKALAVGSALDVEVIRRIKGAAKKSVDDYWNSKQGLSSCTGYMIKEKQEQRDARFLKGLPNLTAAYHGKFEVLTNELPLFTRHTACWPRKRSDYQAPLVLLKQSPGASREEGWAFLSFEDLAFSQDFYGYSSANHADKKTVARYLFLFCHSVIWIHYALLTAPVLGAERRVIYKSVLDECPLVPFENLGSGQRSLVKDLSTQLLSGNTTVLPQVDLFFAGLYGLDELDLEVIRDTLDVCLPYDESRARACGSPNPSERETFRRRLESAIRPFFKALGKEPQVTLWESGKAFLKPYTPFGILFVTDKGHPATDLDDLSHDLIVNLANDTGSTRIIQKIMGGLRIGILSQYRYWTPSRARLLGAEIVRQYMGVFEE